MSHSFDAFRLNSLSPDTLCPRAGIGQGDGSPLEVPIVQSTTFCKGSLASTADHAYSRVSNPTNSALEEALGQLEDAPAAEVASAPFLSEAPASPPDVLPVPPEEITSFAGRPSTAEPRGCWNKC